MASRVSNRQTRCRISKSTTQSRALTCLPARTSKTMASAWIPLPSPWRPRASTSAQSRSPTTWRLPLRQLEIATILTICRFPATCPPTPRFPIVPCLLVRPSTLIAMIPSRETLSCLPETILRASLTRNRLWHVTRPMDVRRTPQSTTKHTPTLRHMPAHLLGRQRDPSTLLCRI